MCVFCDKIKNKEYFYENEKVVAFYDNYPVNKGHTLIIPKRCIENYFETTKEEVVYFDKALKDIKKILDEKYCPNGYNIGINNGIASGQTIMHLHIHLIPRYDGDTPDPKGGVRGVIKEKQKY